LCHAHKAIEKPYTKQLGSLKGIRTRNQYFRSDITQGILKVI